MAMTTADIAAENARRTIGLILAGADNAGCRNKVTFDITALGRLDRTIITRRHENSCNVEGAKWFIARHTNTANERGWEIEFYITPNWPSFSVIADSVSTHRR
jgi:hypothetical protein